MVALCAGCDDLYPWAAMILGFVAGVSLVCWHRFMLWLKVDDPLDAVAGMYNICQCMFVDNFAEF